MIRTAAASVHARSKRSRSAGGISWNWGGGGWRWCRRRGRVGGGASLARARGPCRRRRSELCGSDAFRAAQSRGAARARAPGSTRTVSLGARGARSRAVTPHRVADVGSNAFRRRATGPSHAPYPPRGSAPSRYHLSARNREVPGVPRF